jgi:membrane associated rhomboid family serine protease
MFAPEVERAMGPKRFAVLYFGAGVFAGLLSCVAMYSTFEANRQIIGASGAVMGVLAGYGRLFPNRVVNLFLVFPMKAKHCVWLLAGMEMLAVFMGNDSGIASVAHLGGFAAGFLFIRYEWTLHSALLRSIERHYDRERETDRQIRERVDQLLGKVNREGIDNLTWRERAFLKRASKRFKRQNR